MTQQHVVDEATARAMFPHGFGPDEPGPHYPPSITWLAGPIACKACKGKGRQPLTSYAVELIGRPVAFMCPRCDGLGYPTSLNIQSKTPHVTRTPTVTTLYGVVDLGAPVPVVYVLDPIGENYEEEVVIAQDGRIWSKGVDVTNAIAGTATPGDVLYPITVRS